jgi:hypothetical protein
VGKINRNPGGSRYHTYPELTGNGSYGYHKKGSGEREGVDYEFDINAINDIAIMIVKVKQPYGLKISGIS